MQFHYQRTAFLWPPGLVLRGFGKVSWGARAPVSLHACEGMESEDFALSIDVELPALGVQCWAKPDVFPLSWAVLFPGSFAIQPLAGALSTVFFSRVLSHSHKMCFIISLFSAGLKGFVSSLSPGIGKNLGSHLLSLAYSHPRTVQPSIKWIPVRRQDGGMSFADCLFHTCIEWRLCNTHPSTLCDRWCDLHPIDEGDTEGYR